MDPDGWKWVATFAFWHAGIFCVYENENELGLVDGRLAGQRVCEREKENNTKRKAFGSCDVCVRLLLFVCVTVR